MKIRKGILNLSPASAGPAPFTLLTSISDPFPQEGTDGLLEQTINLELLPLREGPWNHQIQLQAEEGSDQELLTLHL